VRREVFEQPFNEDRLKAYKATLPKDGDYYVVEGDLLLTEEELKVYALTKSQASEPVQTGGELLVNVHRGRLDYYQSVNDRDLTYAVDRQSFPREEQYQAVVSNMALAGSQWQSLCIEGGKDDCRVQFRHLKEHDANPSHSKVRFIVRFHNSGGAYVAAAFFPHDEVAERLVKIDPKYFTTRYDRVGVLRHELGHVLGYRHEHIRNLSDCYFDAEDNEWLPLTEYDSKSVMHYYCSKTGSDFKFEFTEVDKYGHRKLYGLTQPTAISNNLLREPAFRQNPYPLVITFEGGNTPNTFASVVSILESLNAVRMVPYTAEKGSTAESLFREKLNLPTFSPALAALTDKLNGRKVSGRALEAGETVLLPDLTVDAFNRTVKLDLSSGKDRLVYENILKNWQGVLVSDEQVTGSLRRLKLKTFELKLSLASEEQQEQVEGALKDYTDERNLKTLVVYTPPKEEPPQYFSNADSDAGNSSSSQVRPPEDVDAFINLLQKEGVVGGQEGAVGSVIRMPRLPVIDESEYCKKDCPEIVLIDKPVQLHPDIADAVKMGGVASPGAAFKLEQNRQNLLVVEFSKEVDHGTHLAGIIASRPNGFGIVGVHPNSQIYALSWDTLSSQLNTLTKIIAKREEETENSGAIQIYVLASDYTYPEKPANRDARIDHNSLTKTIEAGKLLWIQAAGQADAKKKKVRRDITYLDQEGFMNLGDLESVIVVTACEDCYGPAPRIMPDANYSTTSGLVHIAAPGEAIPSTVTVVKPDKIPYGKAGGTSQATALVAGVASAMISYWPRLYKQTMRVKIRLQVTSRPVLAEDDVNKVTAGILDPQLALLNPSGNYLRPRGKGGIPPSVGSVRWTLSELNMTDANDNPIGNNAVANIYRLYRMSDGRWMVYAKVLPEAKRGRWSEHRGEIVKIGPVNITTDSPDVPVLMTGDGKLHTLDEIEDVLLSTPVSDLVRVVKNKEGKYEVAK
jgi:hypothetical protein